MKFAIYGPHFPPMSFPCGAADFTNRYAQKWSSEVDELYVITHNAAAEVPQAYNQKIKLIIIPGDSGPLHMLHIAKEIKKLQIDMVDIQYEAFMFSAKGWVFLLPFLCRNIEWILTLHSMDLPRIGGKVFRFIQMKFFHKVIFYSEYYFKRMSERLPQYKKKFYHLGFPSNITKVSPNNLNRFLNSIEQSEFAGKDLFTYFGHINEHRNLEFLINNFAEHLKKSPNAHLVIMSKFNPEQVPYHKDLLSYIGTKGLEDSITFTGLVSDAQISTIFTISKAIILPFSEGVSKKNGSFMTAVDHQTPIITTKSELTESDIESSKGLFWFAIDDDQSLQKQFEKFPLSSELHKEACNSLKALSHSLSWEHYIEIRKKIMQ